MAIRLSRASSQYLERTATVLDHNAPYSVLWSFLLVSDVNDYADIFLLENINGATDTEFMEVGSDGTTLRMGCLAGRTSGASLNVGQWVNLAMVRSSATDLRMFLNGEQTGSTLTNNVSSRSACNRITIGTWYRTTEYQNGRYANVKVFQRALTPAELAVEHAKLRPTSYTDLWAWYPMIDNALAGALLDYSGNGRHLTSVNSPTIEDGPPIGWGAPILLVGRAAGGEPVEIDCETGTAVAAGIAASVSSPVTVACNAGQAVAAGLAAGVSSAATIQAGIGAATASGLTAGIASPVTIACAVGQAEASGLQASISAGAVIDCAVGAAQAAGLPAGVSSAVTIACEVGAAVAEGLQAAVSSDAAILADVGRAVAAGLPATIETVVSLSGWQKPAGKARKYRRVILGDRLYEVLERDIPALLEAELLDRAPPTTAEVIEGPKPRRKRAKKAPQPVKTVEQVRETVQQIKRRIEPDNAWLMQALESVAQRVLERLQDEEDSLMLLLAA